MESDDDVLLSSPLVEASLLVPQRKLKRLKKTIRVSLEEHVEIEDPATGPKNSSEFDDPLLQKCYGSEDFSGRNALVDDDDDEEEESRAKRALNFGSIAGESSEIGEDRGKETEEEIADLRSPDLIEEENCDEKNQVQKNKRKERVNDVGENDEKIKEKPFNKRRLEKERQENLKQLFAESQRLLRETRDASFKFAPVVKKPISSVLEKIRKRKLELTKKYKSNRRLCSGYNDNESSRELESGNKNESNNIRVQEASNIETIASPLVGDCCADSPCKGKIILQMATNEESKQEFRAPIDDTQDLFSDSQISDSKGETPSRSSLEELIAPSGVPFNLQLDSEPPDDVLSDDDDDDDEDYDKENIDPGPRGSADLSPPPTYEAVRTLVDDEAEEEDDSDKENDEDEDDGDIKELRDMIATGYKEKPINNEKRNELHQKWLEQQDADETENLLQKLKQGSQVRKPTLIEDGEEEEEEEEEERQEQGEELVESGHEGGEDLAPSTLVKMNLRKAKQMMAQMFTDDDEGYVSSSDGEETEEKLTKQYLLERAEKKASLFSPAEDKSSREVFGRIKKMNVAPENKKRAKTQSYFDMSHMGVNISISSKSSFLGRGISASVMSSKKQGSMAVRSFIFERDDSNSKSSKSASTESSETIQVENRHRTVSAKFVSSQTRVLTQNTESTALRSETSLLDLLKRSSFAALKQGALDSVVPQTESLLSSFKLVKKSLNLRQDHWS